MRAPYFIANFFWAVRHTHTFDPALRAFVEALSDQGGVYASDNLVTFGRMLSFTRDPQLLAAFNAHAKSKTERGILWRTAVLAWAARRAMRLDGAYVECGCYAGTTARILLEVADFSARGAYLYDLFDHADGEPHIKMPDHGPDLFERVQARFADLPYVSVTRGRIPECLGNAPDKIALLHIDLNNREGEIGALEALYDRVVPGGAIVLDDYGCMAFADQHDAEIAWFAERGCPVLELPTGQGLVIR